MENKMNDASMAKTERKIKNLMSIFMGVSLSFFLSFVGVLSSGHFTLIGWLLSFFISALISIIVGLVIPIRKICTACCAKCGFKERTLPFHLLDSLISDLIYTPFLTFVMGFLACFMAKRQVAKAFEAGTDPKLLPQIDFFQLFLPAVILTIIVGYFLIFILQPLFMKFLLKKYRPEAFLEN